jgi:divalent metal cation (Fe/Co/Zn/Cd) transporter
VAFTFLAFLSRTLGYDKIAMLSFNTAMIGLFSISLFNAVTLPLSYKFGAQGTRYISLFICMAMFFLSSLSVFKNAGVFNFMVGSPNNVPIGTVLLACSIVLNIISFVVSYSIYKKKDF